MRWSKEGAENRAQIIRDGASYLEVFRGNMPALEGLEAGKDWVKV
ncbi:MAG: hypothetical protein ACOC1S_01470 [bacterium]